MGRRKGMKAVLVLLAAILVCGYIPKQESLREEALKLLVKHENATGCASVDEDIHASAHRKLKEVGVGELQTYHINFDCDQGLFSTKMKVETHEDNKIEGEESGILDNLPASVVRFLKHERWMITEISIENVNVSATMTQAGGWNSDGNVIEGSDGNAIDTTEAKIDNPDDR